MKIIIQSQYNMNQVPIYEMTSKEIKELLDLPVRSLEKHKYGEVMTPVSLINEVLDHLPDTVWRNPDLRWLDPACGIGNFFILAFPRLMSGLARKIPNREKRATHILQKMLFFNELNPENAKRARQIFGPSANITISDFLAEEEGKESSPKYDIIVGNPPYQISNDGKASWGAKGRSHTLWPEFLKRSLSLLNPAGYLGMITPASWRSPAHPLLSELKEMRYLQYLHIYGKQAGIDLFHAQTRFDIYVVQNRPPAKNEKTEIVDEKGNILHMAVQRWPFLPNYFFKEIKEILLFPTDSRKTRKARPAVRTMKPIYHSNLYNSPGLMKAKTRKSKYPVVHTITKKGLGILYADHTSPDQIGVPKVLLNFNEVQYPYNDSHGEYGMSQLTFGIHVNSKKEGDALVAYINTPFFKEVVKATKWGVFYTNYKMFEYFRFPSFGIK
jgi:Eco57I restriction-modification methylase